MSPHFGLSLLSTAYLPPVEYFFAIAHSDRVLIEQHENYQKQSWRSRCRILSTAGPEDLSIPIVKEEFRGRPIRDIRIDYSEPWLQHHVRALAAAYNRSAFFDYYADDIIPILESRPVFLFDLNMSLLERLMVLLGLDTPVGLTDGFITPEDASLRFDTPVVASLRSDTPVVASLRSDTSLSSQEKCSSSEVSPASLRVDVPSCGASLRSDTPLSSQKECSSNGVSPAPLRLVFDGRSRIQPKYKGESLLAEFHCEQAYYQVFVNRDPSSGQLFIPNLSIIDLLSAEGPDAGSFLRI